MKHTGLIAVLIRQTNIIWLGYFAIEHALDIFDRKMEQPVPPHVLSNASLHIRVSIIKNFLY